MRIGKRTGIFIGLVMMCAAASVHADDARNAAVMNRAQAVEALVFSGESDIPKFIDEHIADSYRARVGSDSLTSLLERIRRVGSSAGGIMLKPSSGGITMIFEGDIKVTTVNVNVDTQAPYQIVEITAQEDDKPEAEKIPWLEALSWNTLEKTMKTAEENGFSGTVLVVRDGDTVLHEGYGMADRERGIPCSPNTVYAIGSTPIDFTHASILYLRDHGKLKTSDPITKFIDDVPEDKRGITIRHLMDAKSGLSNFHDIPGVDADTDLSWIDRSTAIDRMLSRKLLFEPGQGEAHSHSAWGLLAAIVEIVSGQTYGEFLQHTFFEPADMKHTSLYEDTRSLDPDVLAAGYGMLKPSDPNTPAHWGKTSWLVMGSGGMVSTPMDLYRWRQAMQQSDILSAESKKEYTGGGVAVGGNSRGFFCIYTSGKSSVYLCSNSHEDPDDMISKLGMALVRLSLKDK